MRKFLPSNPSPADDADWGKGKGKGKGTAKSNKLAGRFWMSGWDAEIQRDLDPAAVKEASQEAKSIA